MLNLNWNIIFSSIFFYIFSRIFSIKFVRYLYLIIFYDYVRIFFFTYIFCFFFIFFYCFIFLYLPLIYYNFYCYILLHSEFFSNFLIDYSKFYYNFLDIFPDFPNPYDILKPKEYYNFFFYEKGKPCGYLRNFDTLPFPSFRHPEIHTLFDFPILKKYPDLLSNSNDKDFPRIVPDLYENSEKFLEAIYKDKEDFLNKNIDKPEALVGLKNINFAYVEFKHAFFETKKPLALYLKDTAYWKYVLKYPRGGSIDISLSTLEAYHLIQISNFLDDNNINVRYLTTRGMYSTFGLDPIPYSLYFSEGQDLFFKNSSCETTLDIVKFIYRGQRFTFCSFFVEVEKEVKVQISILFESLDITYGYSQSIKDAEEAARLDAIQEAYEYRIMHLVAGVTFTLILVPFAIQLLGLGFQPKP